MKLIEKLGGYGKALQFLKSEKNSLEIDPVFYLDGQEILVDVLDDALLEYRRQHNIFERNDYVVNRDIKYSDELNIVSSSNDKALWFFGKIYGGFVKSQFRHATDEEIKAGKRLEVKSDS